MKTTWILVAQRAGARLFVHRGYGRAVQLVREVSHPEGRLPDRELGTDRPGRSYSTGSAGRSSLSQHEGPSEHLATAFAATLAEILRKGRDEHAYDTLVLVAEPRFLGKLQGALDPATAARVVGTVPKELTSATEVELTATLGAVMPI